MMPGYNLHNLKFFYSAAGTISVIAKSGAAMGSFECLE